jgi:hypothetical protein
MSLPAFLVDYCGMRLGTYYATDPKQVGVSLFDKLCKHHDVTGTSLVITETLGNKPKSYNFKATRTSIEPYVYSYTLTDIN